MSKLKKSKKRKNKLYMNKLLELQHPPQKLRQNNKEFLPLLLLKRMLDKKPKMLVLKQLLKKNRESKEFTKKT